MAKAPGRKDLLGSLGKDVSDEPIKPDEFVPDEFKEPEAAAQDESPVEPAKQPEAFFGLGVDIKDAPDMPSDAQMAELKDILDIKDAPPKIEKIEQTPGGIMGSDGKEYFMGDAAVLAHLAVIMVTGNLLQVSREAGKRMIGKMLGKETTEEINALWEELKQLHQKSQG